MLQADEPDTFVLATGRTETVRDFVSMSAKAVGITLSGEVVNVCSGQGYALRDILQMAESLTGHHMEIRVNPAFVRANEVPRLLGSSARLQQYLGPLSQIPLRDATLDVGGMRMIRLKTFDPVPDPYAHAQ